MIIFENDHVKILHSRGDGSRDRILITFNSHIPSARLSIVDKNPLKGGWQKESEDLSLPALYVIEKKNIWFNFPQMADVVAVTRSIRDKYRECNMVGASLGGHAAIRLSKRMNATTTVAVSPQYCIRPELVSEFETRWRGEAGQIKAFDRPISSDTVAGDIHMIVDDEHEMDMAHVRRIADLVPVNSIVRLPHSGHSSARAMADLGLIDPMLKMTKETSFDVLYNIKNTYDRHWMSSPAALTVKANRMEPKERLSFMSSATPRSPYERHLQMFKDLLEKTRAEIEA